MGQLYKTMGIFDSLKIYAGKWSVSDSRAFTPQEIAEISEATVVDSTYGFSVCFTLKAGGQAYIPVSTECEGIADPGNRLDLRKCQLITLEKQGESDIMRVGVSEDAILK